MSEPTIELSEAWWSAILEQAEKEFVRFPWDSNASFIDRVTSGQATPRSAIEDRHDMRQQFHAWLDRHLDLLYWDPRAAMCAAYIAGKEAERLEVQAPAPAPEVPADMVLVPREPTPTMLERARHAPIPAVLLDSISARADLETKARWAAMLAAAPATQAPAVGATSSLDPDEGDAVTLWAEIHRLRAAVQGPDGYASWQDAATAERMRRVAGVKVMRQALEALETCMGVPHWPSLTPTVSALRAAISQPPVQHKEGE